MKASINVLFVSLGAHIVSVSCGGATEGIRKPIVSKPILSKPILSGGILGGGNIQVGGKTVDGRVPILGGGNVQVVGRSFFKGVFKYSKDGLGGTVLDMDKEKSTPEDADRVGDAEAVARASTWHGVNSGGEQFEVAPSVEVIKQLLNLDLGTTDQLFRLPDLSGGMRMTNEVDAIAVEEKFALLAKRATRNADAAEAGQRNGTAAAILGADTRYEVSPANWRPTKQTGLLTFNGGFCSGALVGPRHVLTAGHCVHEGDGGDWFGNFRFYPGRSTAGGAAPYGVYGWRQAWTYTGWTRDGNSDHDFALIELNSAPGIGWLSFGWSSGLSTSWYVYHKGYSGDKPYGSQWSTGDNINDVWTSRFYTDDSDTTGGNSGGPVYKYVNSNPVVYGPHSGWNAYWYWFGQKKNRHTRITSAKFASLCDWINDPNVC